MIEIPNSLYTNSQGRLGRVDFWVFGIIPLLLALLCGWLVDRWWSLKGWPVLIALIAWAFPLAVVLVKRWHDRDRPWQFALIALIPVGGQIWTLIECGFLPGIDNNGSGNRFGANPALPKPGIVSPAQIRTIGSESIMEPTDLNVGTEVIHRKNPAEEVIFVLTLRRDDGGEERLEISEEDRRERRKLILGRKSSCDWSVGNTSVSRHHAELSWDQGALIVRDLGSTSGTFVNGGAVDSNAGARLRDGDVLELGEVQIVINHSHTNKK